MNVIAATEVCHGNVPTPSAPAEGPEQSLKKVREKAADATLMSGVHSSMDSCK